MTTYDRSRLTLPNGDIINFQDKVSGYAKSISELEDDTVTTAADNLFNYRETNTSYDGYGGLNKIKGNTIN